MVLPAADDADNSTGAAIAQKERGWRDNSYIGDWMFAFLSALLGGLIDKMKTTERYEGCMQHVQNNASLVTADACGVLWDSTIAYPWPAKGEGTAEETMSTSTLFGIILGIPALVLGVVQLVRSRCIVGGWAAKEYSYTIRHDCHHFCLAVLEAFGITLLITQAAKHYVGRLRPVMSTTIPLLRGFLGVLVSSRKLVDPSLPPPTHARDRSNPPPPFRVGSKQPLAFFLLTCDTSMTHNNAHVGPIFTPLQSARLLLKRMWLIPTTATHRVTHLYRFRTCPWSFGTLLAKPAHSEKRSRAAAVVEEDGNSCWL